VGQFEEEDDLGRASIGALVIGLLAGGPGLLLTGIRYARLPLSGCPH
jgi:hypothetical protein